MNVRSDSLLKTDIINSPEIDNSLFDKIFEIEQDMWARGIGEYVRCDSCQKIFSKEDIYASGDLEIPDQLRTETVQKIEILLGKMPDCPCCQSLTYHVYGYDEYIGEIINRNSSGDSYLSLTYDNNGNIVGFMDGYIETLEEIFDREFSYHFSPNLLDYLWEKYKKHRLEKMLTVSSIGTDDKNKSLSRVFELLRDFFSKFDNSYDNTPVIIESIVGSTTYCIFDLMGANKLGITHESGLLGSSNINTEYPTDILFQSGAIKSYRENFNVRARDVVIHSRSLQAQA